MWGHRHHPYRLEREPDHPLAQTKETSPTSQYRPVDLPPRCGQFYSFYSTHLEDPGRELRPRLHRLGSSTSRAHRPRSAPAHQGVRREAFSSPHPPPRQLDQGCRGLGLVLCRLACCRRVPMMPGSWPRATVLWQQAPAPVCVTPSLVSA
jgi:hypothetical protein